MRHIWSYSKRTYSPLLWDCVRSVKNLLRTVASNTWKSEKNAIISSIDDPKERVTYRVPETLISGSKAELKIRFAGTLAGNMVGYYRARWDHKGTTEYYALTQLAVRHSRHFKPGGTIDKDCRLRLPDALFLVGTSHS